MAALVHPSTSWDPFHNGDVFDMTFHQSHYPESDLRSIAYTKPTPLATSPLQTPSTSRSSSCDVKSPTFTVVCCEYPTAILPSKQLEPGVWSNGTRHFYSAEWYPVQEYLQQAKHDMCLPSPPSDLIFTLAALSVFYELSNPVHWMFWNDRNKDQTAAIVDRISLQRPALMRSKVKWNGLKEYMWLLENLHGAPSLPLYKNKEWYRALGNHKAASPQRSLRKRKPKADLEDPLTILDEEAAVEREPRLKRHKSSHSTHTTVSLTEPGIAHNNNNNIEVSPAATTLSIEDISSLSPLSTLLDDISPEPVTSEEPPRPKRTSNRKSRQARTFDISTPSDTSSLSTLLTLLTPATTGQSRDRSGSQSTLVNGRRSRGRSASVLSAITTIESLTQLEPCDTKNLKSGVSEADGEREEEVGMVTRRRGAIKAKASTQNAEPGKTSKRTRKKASSD